MFIKTWHILGKSPYSLNAPLSGLWDLTNVGPTKSWKLTSKKPGFPYPAGLPWKNESVKNLPQPSMCWIQGAHLSRCSVGSLRSCAACIKVVWGDGGMGGWEGCDQVGDHWMMGRIGVFLLKTRCGWITLREINSEFTPKNGWLEYDRFLLGWPIFRCYVSFRECILGGGAGRKLGPFQCDDHHQVIVSEKGHL